MGVLQCVVDEVAQHDFDELTVAVEAERGGAENEVYIVFKSHARGGHALKHLAEGKNRGLELQSAGDGEVCPVFDI